MNENNPHEASSTPFDGSPVHSPEMPIAADSVLESSPPIAQRTGDKPADDTLPENVKIAGALLIAHGACLGLNGVLYGQQANDNGNILTGLLWFGCTFVLCGALYERKAWAWWVVTLLGGGIGVINLLSSVGVWLSSAVLRGEQPLGVSFIVPIIFIAAIAMLTSVTLLLTPSSKAVFGLKEIS